MTNPTSPWTDGELLTAAAMYARITAIIKSLIAGSNAVGTTDANGYATVSHGLSYTPSRVIAQNTGAVDGAHAFFPALVDTITSTSFRVRFLTLTGSGTTLTLAVAATKPYQFDWVAIP